MNRIKRSIIVAMAMVCVPVFAQQAPPANPDATPRINARQMRQQRRIGQGVKSGELTPAETRHLEAREMKIQRDKKEAKSDGVVTPAERGKITREQNRVSRAIRRKKLNGR